jgi:hypothetical protein
MGKYSFINKNSNFIKVSGKEFNEEVMRCESSGKISHKLGVLILDISKNIVLKLLGWSRIEIQENAHEELVMKGTEKVLRMNYKKNAYNYFVSMLINTCKNFIIRNKFDLAGNVTKLNEIGIEDLKINK